MPVDALVVVLDPALAAQIAAHAPSCPEGEFLACDLRTMIATGDPAEVCCYLAHHGIATRYVPAVASVVTVLPDGPPPANRAERRRAARAARRAR